MSSLRRILEFPNVSPADERALDAAIEEGRIPRGDRSYWLQGLVDYPQLTRRQLAELEPDTLEASRSYFADPAHERAYREHYRVMFGEEPVV